MKRTDKELALMTPQKRAQLIWQRKNKERLSEYQKQYKKLNVSRVSGWKNRSKSCRLKLTKEEWKSRGIISDKINSKLYYRKYINPSKLVEATKLYMHRYYTEPEFKINARIRLKKWRLEQRLKLI